MKKRLFRMLLMLCLLVAALTVITLTVMASTVPSDYSMRFYGDTLPQGNTPVTEINMNATFYCQKCKKTTVLAPSSIITLTGIQFPVDNDHHKMALTGSISTVTCSNCKNSIGPINFNVTFAAQNGFFCHNGVRHELLEASGSQTIDSGSITFTIGTTPNYTLTDCSAREASCSQVGLRRACRHCDGCDKYFESKSDAEIPASDIISKTAHTYDPETGKCNVCQAQAPARLDNTIYETFTEALEAYNKNGGTLTVYSLPADASVDLAYSGTLVINNGAAVPKITMSDGLEVTIENHGTISSIEMDKHPGTLTIKNNKQIDLIRTDTPIDGDVRTINVTNYSDSTINKLEAPNTMLTVRNDGTIGELIGYFDSTYNDANPQKSMVTLQRGAGIYQKITSWEYWAEQNKSTTDAADFSKLLSSGDYFYFPNGKIWRNEATDGQINYASALKNVYFTCHPFSSITVTGKAGELSVDITQVGNTFNMTVDAGQTVSLTGDVVLPKQGLKSDKEKLAYSWYCKTTSSSGSGREFQFTDILFGEYDLTLTVRDNEYNHTKSVNIHITVQQGEQKTPLFLKEPTPPEVGFFEKPYDGTDKPPYDLRSITFYTTGDREISVDKKYCDFTIRYPSPNCTGDDPVNITATVWLTDDGKEHFTLGTDGTASFTVPGKITQVSAAYKILPQAARVGDHIFSCFMLETNFYKDGYQYPGSLNPGADMKVDGEALPVTFYRLHPSNIINNEKADDLTAGSDFVSDPEIDEPLTKDSVFKYAGKYYIYAIVKPTTNYVGEITNCRVINVQETEASAKHHEGYTAWDGMTTVPIKAGEEKSVYLSGSLPTIYTELLLGLKKNLTLCLNGKTLSATNSTTSFDQIRVTGGAKLTIDDCAGTGTAKGTVVSSGVGGIAYVQNGSITINGGKFTGGTAKTGGGAIVVDEGGELNIIGGEISGNTVTDGDGGAIYIKSGGIVNIHGGKITGNHVTSGNGGAIYVAAGGTLNLYGGEISDNTASGLGGGIYVEKGGELHIQNAPVVMDNTANGKASNVYLAGNDQQLSAVNMTAGAKIGISVEASLYPARFALSPTDTSAYFTPDTKGLSVVYLKAGGLSLVAKPTATLDDNTLTVSTGGGYPDDTVLFVAEYDANNGKMTAVHIQDVTSKQTSFTVNSSSKIKCFLLRKDTYTPLLEAFSPDSN